ncbi:hypothetical protein P152DRAFT_67182 [Eremomyces bilateralis CBS 781.70]|uniref:Jacalin-type lectin domain-containing protein n=1 Tax=Eremomyces bilateralis CBS 781.70 TaxID=1392243 RepID=A0A6G1G000_9PEZI|nr:uncharacterized protein P152DRAFT_67182 [Eremomyces bilateralis CBS 781.70]KAF1811256.1 hypothetical protein P152DRAFT_67182 [Eremomyces bilateralis CBS 781.70]
MPSILKSVRDLRRRSRANLNRSTTSLNEYDTPDNSSGNSSNDSSNTPRPAAAGDLHQSSSSSLSLMTTPTSATPSESGSITIRPNDDSIPPLPSKPTLSSNRNSVIGSVAGGPPPGERMAAASGPFAPRISSPRPGEQVYQKVLLINGQIGQNPNELSARPQGGQLKVTHHQDSFPATQWKVQDSQFKALVHLTPGPNKITLLFEPTRHSHGSHPSLGSSRTTKGHESWFMIYYVPPESPPLQLVMLLGSDSPGTYDAIPARVSGEGNNLDVAIRKYRMAAYMWQAFTAEQMHRHGFGRRTFQFEESWLHSSLSLQEYETGVMRSQATVHVIRVDKTVAELRDLEYAQQYAKATKKSELFNIAADAVREYFRPRNGQKIYVSCMYLDSHWDPQVKTIRAHAALGGCSGDVNLAIFGSHCLQSYPSSIEEVPNALVDCTRTDTAHVANDAGEAGSSWEAANIGIGAHMHEVGHLFGCPHQESGVMQRDYTRLHRTFLTREAFSTRTKQQGMYICKPSDECGWHRLDALRFRYHPSFRLPKDPPMANADSGIQTFCIKEGEALIMATSGICFIEIRTESDDICHHWLDFTDVQRTDYLPKSYHLTDDALRKLLPSRRRKSKLKVSIHSIALNEHTIDWDNFASKSSRVELMKGSPTKSNLLSNLTRHATSHGFRGSKLGHSQLPDSEAGEIVFNSVIPPNRFMTSIKIYHGNSVDGIEFCYEDSTSQLLGKRGGKPGGSEFKFDTRSAEQLFGFYVRAGAWIDGIQILATSGRKSEIFGNATGGSGHRLVPPANFQISGVYGSCGAWMDGFGVIISH